MSNPMVHQLEFRGNGWEYSKIYFVNLALSILTLGIYSAWAKVRNKRYFYGNTSLDGSSFDYHASPMQILKGRLLVVGAFILYNIIVGIVPAVSFLFMIVFLVAMPWLILKATQFNMRNSSFRQIRFDFLGELKAMFTYYVLLPIASLFTLGLAYPYAVYKQKKYLADNSSFGQSGFTFNGKSKEFFQTYLTAFLGVILFFILLGFLFGSTTHAFTQGFEEAMAQQQVHQLAANAAPQEEPDPDAMAAAALAVIMAYGGMILITLVVMTYINTRITNYLFNNLKLSYVRFKASISYWQLMWIYLSNMILIILSMGIFIPWAKIRAVKYKLSCVTVYAADLNGFLASETVSMKALGEEMSDFLDVDVGF
jgi:uncharacterized membrane protein YjgN (DUF898 family)